MNKVLVAYVTMSGSTAEVASVVGEEIANQGFQVDVLPIEKAGVLSEYDAVVLGAPMAIGWHRSALKYLTKHRDDLSRVPWAIFVMAMSLTWRNETVINDVSVCIDTKLAKPLPDTGHPSIKERYSSVDRYAAPILKAAIPAKPVSIGFFGGRLEYQRLKPLAMLFVMLVIQAQAGDRRDWKAIRSWASSLPDLFDSRKARG